MAVQTYSGGCQCGAVRFEASADLDHTATCNCSRCGRLGAIWSFVPAGAFTLLAGEDALTTFRFNKRIIEHRFCSTCGIEPFGRGIAPDGSATVALNVRCLDAVDLDALAPAKFDGASL